MMTELPLVTMRQYIRTLSHCIEHVPTFRAAARALQRDLSDPSINASELIRSIHNQPASPFENYLRQQVQRSK